MPISVEEFHQAWANQVLRAQAAEGELDKARKRIAELEQENLKLKEAVEKTLRQADEKKKPGSRKKEAGLRKENA